MQMLPSKLKSAVTFLDQLCKPNPNYFSNSFQLELMHKRIKVFLAFEIMMIIIFLAKIIVSSDSLSVNLQGVLVTLFVLLVYILTRNYNPELFRIFYNFINLAFGFFLAYHNEKGIHGSWLAVQTFPMLVYSFHGSIVHFSLNAAVQLILMNAYYQHLLKRSLLYLTPDEFVESLTYHSHQNMLYMIITILLNHYISQNAYYRIIIVNRKKEEIEKQKNFFLSFSHELRNLINSLMGNVKLAALEELSDKVKDFLQNGELCGELLLHLVNNILDSGKVEFGNLEVNSTPVRIYETMERVWGVCSELIKRKNLRGRMKIQKNMPQTLSLDHHRLTQIFLNLIGNAVKFTDTGNIDISVEWMGNFENVDERCFEPYPFNDDNDKEEGIFEKKQALSVLDENLIILSSTAKKINSSVLIARNNLKRGVLKITVSDSGIGMTKSDTEKLFQRFSQVTSDDARRKLGTGLGLSITKELCHGMNGEVKVFSKYGKGTVFIFCLPVELSSVD